MCSSFSVTYQLISKKGTFLKLVLKLVLNQILKLVLKQIWKLVFKLVGWFGWLKGQRGKMGVKGPKEKNDDEMEDVSQCKTMPLAAGKNSHRIM